MKIEILLDINSKLLNLINLSIIFYFSKIVYLFNIYINTIFLLLELYKYLINSII